MPGIPDTVDIACPRCHDPIVCTLDVTTAPPKPGGARVIAAASVPDLADRFAEHYRSAGHSPRARYETAEADNFDG